LKPITVGVVDYSIGNQASLAYSLRALGYRVLISCQVNELNSVDLLILPGVGAFPAVMAALQQRGLDTYLRSAAHAGRPMIGICVGMQLLTSGSRELGFTKGLDLISGEVIPFEDRRAHIGWNTVVPTYHSNESTAMNSLFYFNHSYYVTGAGEYTTAFTEHSVRFASALRHKNIIGLQFHPEKSQNAGKLLFTDLIKELVVA
jgi:glutamine amidotransferase